MTEQTVFHNFVVAEETLKNNKMDLELMEVKESQATEAVQPVTNDSLIVLSLLFFLMEVISSHCPQLFRNIEISLAWLSQSGGIVSELLPRIPRFKSYSTRLISCAFHLITVFLCAPFSSNACVSGIGSLLRTTVILTYL